jgi:hypothetical protein
MKSIKLFLVLISLNSYSQIPTEGLIAYWPMNGNFNDFGPLNINGTNNNVTSATNYLGENDTSMSFTNLNSDVYTVDQYGSHPSNANLNFGHSQNFSIDFNIYFYSVSTDKIGGGIYNYGSLNTYNIWSRAFNGSPQIIFTYAGTIVLTASGFFNFNTWYHITAIKQGGFIKIYVNGTLQDSETYGATVPNYNNNAYGLFGSMISYNNPNPIYRGFNGKIDDLRIYNRSLDLIEIQNINQYYGITLETDGYSSNIKSKRTFYPNPSSDKIIINDSIGSFEIFNLNGKRMNLPYQKKEVDITGLSKGIYILKAIDFDGNSIFEKLIVN